MYNNTKNYYWSHVYKNSCADSKLHLLRFDGDSQEGAILEWKEMFVGISSICHIYYFFKFPLTKADNVLQ
jgi:hypothetical protein